MTTDFPADVPAPQHKPDIYSRIMRFAPLYVIVFCIGIVVLVIAVVLALRGNADARRSIIIK